jgi:hypothetical protein
VYATHAPAASTARRPSVERLRKNARGALLIAYGTGCRVRVRNLIHSCDAKEHSKPRSRFCFVFHGLAWPMPLVGVYRSLHFRT